MFLRAQSAQETWDLPKIQLKVLPHLPVFDLKSPNNSSTAFSYVSFTGTEFTIFPCSSVCRTWHSSPISAPHTAHIPHKRCFQSLHFICTGEICLSNRFRSSQAPCISATSFGTMHRILPGTERSRKTFAHEQQHQPCCEDLSSVFKASLRHYI